MNFIVIMKNDEVKMKTTHSTMPFKFEDIHENDKY